MKPATRRLLTLPIIGAALTLIAFGVIRGAISAGPARGVRLNVAIEPPVDADVAAMAEHVARMRLDGKVAFRIVSNGGQLVVDLGEQDEQVVNQLSSLLERTATLEVHAIDATSSKPGRDVLLEGHMIRRATIREGGVSIDVGDPSVLARVKTGAPIAFVLDGSVKQVATVDRVAGIELHVATPAPTEDAADRIGSDLVAVVEAGAAHALHVRNRTRFQRATGFLPRAWPFLAIGAVLLLVALVIWRRRSE